MTSPWLLQDICISMCMPWNTYVEARKQQQQQQHQHQQQQV
jgi:hypothetical protein